MNVPNERSFQGLFKTCNLSLLSIPETEKKCSQTSRANIGKLHRKRLKIRKFLGNQSPSFFEPVLAALLLLETVRIAPVWVMIQREAIMTPLLETVLQLKEQFNQSFLNKHSLQSNFIHCLHKTAMSNVVNLHRC